MYYTRDYITCHIMLVWTRHYRLHFIHFSGPVYPDDIACPSKKPMDDWLSQFECKTSYPQLDNDLAHFPSINFDDIHEGAVKAYNHSASMSVCNYVVKDNQV